MIQVGNKGDLGAVELQDLLFTATGPTAGVILVEWNIAESSQGAAGMWDVSSFQVPCPTLFSYYKLLSNIDLI
jgi:hypothetical protein